MLKEIVGIRRGPRCGPPIGLVFKRLVVFGTSVRNPRERGAVQGGSGERRFLRKVWRKVKLNVPRLLSPSPPALSITDPLCLSPSPPRPVFIHSFMFLPRCRGSMSGKKGLLGKVSGAEIQQKTFMWRETRLELMRK